MIYVYAGFVGLLVAVAVYLLLHPDAVDNVLGLVVLGHGGNLAVLGAGDLVQGHAPILDRSGQQIADPLPQALVLTAIVISFGLTAFAVVLVARMDRAEEAE